MQERDSGIDKMLNSWRGRAIERGREDGIGAVRKGKDTHKGGEGREEQEREAISRYHARGIETKGDNSDERSIYLYMHA